jgi:hypothetical protein
MTDNDLLSDEEISEPCWKAHYEMFHCTPEEHQTVDLLPCEVQPPSMELVELKRCNEAICNAQKQKMVAEGWKSPDEHQRVVEEWKLTREALKFLTMAEEDVRADERQAMGRKLHWALEISPKVIRQYVDALLRGEKVNG